MDSPVPRRAGRAGGVSVAFCDARADLGWLRDGTPEVARLTSPQRGRRRCLWGSEILLEIEASRGGLDEGKSKSKIRSRER